MISKSALKAKIKRSGVVLDKTFLWEERKSFLQELDSSDVFLSKNENILLVYMDNDNKWVLTNKRLLIPYEFTQIILNEVVKVDIDGIKEDFTTKTTNTYLYLHMRDGTKKVLEVEDKSWHLFYDVFRWIIKTNKDTSQN